MCTAKEIEAIEKEIFELKHKLTIKENFLRDLKEQTENATTKLSNDDISRYSRQILIPQVGVEGQLKIKNASALVVGAGGLGCPAALYLVSAGIGHIGIVDYDWVEKSNLHRQTLHTNDSIHISKAESAKNSLSKINTTTKISEYISQMSRSNSLDLIRDYDVILDCTDNVATRYLLSDACILAKKPLVSGSALQLEGQLTVYNYKGGPCYRCLFPTPPPPETVTNCGDGGVLGAVTGVIGSLQALEALKIILDFEGTLNGRLMLFDGATSIFRNIKLRSKRTNCDICSDKPIITRLIHYEQFCGMRASDKNFSLSVLADGERISVSDYKQLQDDQKPHILIDVRTKNEFQICKLKDSINIPLKEILDDKHLQDIIEAAKKNENQVFLICRRGNDSQLAVRHLQPKMQGIAKPKDIKGGLHAWHYKIDTDFPIY